MIRKPKILIIGGGIGGLTAAIALRQAGLEVSVFERAPELKEVGAGIGLSANAIRVLKHLGLMPQVIERGAVIETAVGYTSQGKVLSTMPTNLADVPTVCLHRADLQQVLFSALPADCVRPAAEFVEVKQAGDEVIASFANGHMATGNALIGADGLRSKVRAQLLADGNPVYRGYQCWRGVCSAPANTRLTETLGLGVRVGVVPLGQRGTAWWCTANEAENATDLPDGPKAKLKRLLMNWHPVIQKLMDATPSAAIIKTPIYDRRPVTKWSRGSCTLLGDAAHPTTPNMGQGACMAIEDAAVLARCLSHYANPPQAFAAYERLRHARTARITNISRYYGIIGQWSNPAAVWFRTALFRLSSGKATTKGYLRFVGYDPYALPLKSA